MWGLIQQIQNLVIFVQNSLTVIPGLIAQVAGQVYQFGPFQFDFRHLDLNPLGQQLVSLIQPVLGQTGTLLGTIASGAAQFLGWLFFVLLSPTLPSPKAAGRVGASFGWIFRVIPKIFIASDMNWV